MRLFVNTWLPNKQYTSR